MTINPALAELQPFVGQWRTELYNASFLPDVDTRATGSMLVEWIEDGSALIMRQGDFTRPPAAAWIIGRDESESGVFGVLFRRSWRVAHIPDEP